jgi:hypothetical protein
MCLLSTAEPTKGEQSISVVAGQSAKRAAEELSSPGAPGQTTKLLLALELPPTLN